MNTLRFSPSSIIGLLLALSSTSGLCKPGSYSFDRNTITSHYYDGKNDGLLGAFGKAGFQQPAPGYVNAEQPTPSEIRRNRIHSNFIDIIDQTELGGFGRLYGLKDNTTWPGYEFLTYAGIGENRAALLVQLPDNFATDKPCIIAAPSSGSRGIYGAVGTVGDWALQHGCVVAYTDVNKGTGAHDLSQGIGFSIEGEAVNIDSTAVTFKTPTADYGLKPTPEALNQYIKNNPHRYAFKHAHSQKNVEKDWGRHTLHSLHFAFYVLNHLSGYNETFTASNTIVIAAGVSNAGAAALRAAEIDKGRIIDGVVAVEPNINPQKSPVPFGIKMGERKSVYNHSKPLYEYATIAELYAACASLAPENKDALFAALRGPVEARCDGLVEHGLLKPSASYADLGRQAQKKINDAGFLTESNRIVAGYAGIDLFQTLLATYGNAYTRSSVVDNLCNISMAAIDFTQGLTPVPNAQVATLAAISGGIPRTANIYLIKDDDPNGPTVQIAATSSNGKKDYNLEGALCWRDIWSNRYNPLHYRLKKSISQIQGSARLHRVPTILLHGRADGLITVNHSSRPYYALNKIREGKNTPTYYYEITNAQHLDTLNQLYASVGDYYIPLKYYFDQTMTLMWSHLTMSQPLPESQVVFTTPPKENEPVELRHMPAIQPKPVSAIRFKRRQLYVPDGPSKQRAE